MTRSVFLITARHNRRGKTGGKKQENAEGEAQMRGVDECGAGTERTKRVCV